MQEKTLLQTRAEWPCFQTWAEWPPSTGRKSHNYKWSTWTKTVEPPNKGHFWDQTFCPL